MRQSMRQSSPVSRRNVQIGALVAVSLVILVLLYIYNVVITRPEVSGVEITTPQGFAAAWTAFTTTWITPLQPSGLSLFWLVVGFTVLARLLALLPVWNRGRSDKYGRRVALGLGIALIIVASVALVSVTPHWHLAVLTGLAGSTLLAVYTARRMVLRIEVKSSADTADAGGAGQLAAFVAELGKDSPKGRLLPRGPDATGLAESDFVGIPTNPFFAAILGVIQGVAGTAPWRVLVCVAEDGSLAVEITRNRRGIETVHIDRRILTLAAQADASATGVASDLYRMAAAVILIEVSKKYSGFDGLCGATDWRSVGRQFIATTEAVDDRERATELLIHAVDDDPKNRLAALALNWRQHRFATDAEEIQTHATWLLGQLEEISDETEGYDALRYRLLLNYLTAVCNLRSIHGHDRDEQQADMRAVGLLWLLRDDGCALAESMRPLAAVALRRLIPDMTGPPPTEYLVRDTLEAKAWLKEEWQSHEWSDTANQSADPHVKYALACYYAQLKPPNVEKGLGLLHDAVVMNTVKIWAADDPALAPLHHQKEFAALVGRVPKATWLGVEPFASYAPKLTKIGIASPEQLVGVLMQPLVVPRPPAVALAAYLGVGSLELTALMRAARFCMAVEAQQIDFTGFQFEVTAELLGRGITEIHQVTMMTSVDRARTATEISASIATRCVACPSPGVIAAWLGGFYPDVDIL